MRFIEQYIPPQHRRLVDAFTRAVATACAEAALGRTTVGMRSDGHQEYVVFTLQDPIGTGSATVECALHERPQDVGRHAYQSACRMIYGTKARPAGR